MSGEDNESSRSPRSNPAAELASESVLDAVFESSDDGVLVLSGDVVVRCNPAARWLLGPAGDRLLGSAVPFAGLSVHDPAAQTAIGTIEVEVDGTRRVVTYRVTPVTGTADQRVVLLRDVTDLQERERQLVAFTRTANRTAYANSLEVVVDHLAEEVRSATGMAMCTVVTFDLESGAMTQAGKAGLPDDYGDRLEACRQNGAPLLTTRVQQSGELLVVPGYRNTLMSDPRFSPLHPVVGPQDWDVFVAVPLRVRNRYIGALTGFLETGKALNERQLQFLDAITNHAALAIENWILAAQMQAKAALEERHRLARDLHDTVSQSLFSLNLHARTAQSAATTAGVDPAHPVARELEVVLELAHSTSNAMSQLIHHLRPEALLREGLLVAITAQARTISDREGIEVVTNLPAEAPSLEKQIELSIFRMVQEAIHNAVKHANASTIEVNVLEPDDGSGTLFVTISDDGVGFDPSTAPVDRLGLATMRERASGLGGSFDITSSQDGGGTRVTIWLPDILDRPHLRRSMSCQRHSVEEIG